MKSDPFAVCGGGGKRIAIRAFKCQLRQLICNSCCVITPAANRNSYRVARLVGALTQGSVLRPQPWAVKSQLCQSCCCLKPLPMPSPRGGSSFLLCLRWLCGALSPWGELERGFGGASERLRGILHLIIYIRARGLGGHSDDRLNFCWHEWRWLLTEFCGLRRLLFW